MRAAAPCARAAGPPTAARRSIATTPAPVAPAWRIRRAPPAQCPPSRSAGSRPTAVAAAASTTLRICPPARSTLTASRIQRRVVQRVGIAQVRTPECSARRRLGHREFQNRVQSPHEGGVEPIAVVARQQGDAVELLDPLQEIVGLRIGKAIIGIADVGARGEQGIGFVEEQEHVGVLGSGQDHRQVLLGLANPLARQRREIDPVQRQAQPRRQPVRRQRFAGAGLANQQRAQTRPVARRHRRPEPLRQTLADPRAHEETIQAVAQARRQHERIVVDLSHGPPGEGIERGGTARHAFRDVAPIGDRASRPRRGDAGARRGLRDSSGALPKIRCCPVRVRRGEPRLPPEPRAFVRPRVPGASSRRAAGLADRRRSRRRFRARRSRARYTAARSGQAQRSPGPGCGMKIGSASAAINQGARPRGGSPSTRARQHPSAEATSCATASASPAAALRNTRPARGIAPTARARATASARTASGSASATGACTRTWSHAMTWPVSTPIM